MRVYGTSGFQSANLIAAGIGVLRLPRGQNLSDMCLLPDVPVCVPDDVLNVLYSVQCTVYVICMNINEVSFSTCDILYLCT